MNSLVQLIKPDCRLPVALTLRSQAMTRKNHKLRLPPAFSIPRVISHRDQTLMRRYASLLVCLLSCLGLIPATIIGYFDDRPFIFTICLTGNLITPCRLNGIMGRAALYEDEGARLVTIREKELVMSLEK